MPNNLTQTFVLDIRPSPTEQAKQISLATSILANYGYTVLSPGESESESASDPSMASTSPEPSFAVLIRHSGEMDQFARREPVSGWNPDSLEAWIQYQRRDDPEGETFASRDEAEKHCQLLGEKFGAMRYRFSVAERRLVPRWFLVDPSRGRETRPVGSTEQL